MDERTPARRPRVAACESCHRLKMRCVGAEDPPCQRCTKAKRPCIIPDGTASPTSTTRSSRRHLTSHAHRSSRLQEQQSHESVTNSQPPTTRREQSVLASSRYGYTMSASPSSDARPTYSPSGGDDVPGSALPSVFDGPSLTTVVGLASRGSVAAGPNELISPSSSAAPRRDITSASVTDREMIEMVEIFCQHMMREIPIFDRTDVHEAIAIVHSRKQLAQCISYVTARYVPGSQHIRSALFPYVDSVLRQAWTWTSHDAVAQMLLFQCLAVLYVYTPFESVYGTSHDKAESDHLSPWAVKAADEGFALRNSLHRSWEPLIRTDQECNTASCSRADFERYLTWLWLFTMSHHASLLTRTPPSIREDMSIEAASRLLGHLKDDPRAQRVLAEVELCLLWKSAGNEKQELAQWWCSPLTPSHNEQGVNALYDLDMALKHWSTKWKLGTRQTPEARTAVSEVPSADFHCRFTRFCVHTYVVRSQQSRLQRTTTAQSTDLAQSRTVPDLLLQSLDAAAAMAAFQLDLGPVERIAQRYRTDFVYAMIAFPCWYILRASETPGLPVATLTNHLRIVSQAAQLMRDLAITSSHCAATFGNKLLEEASKRQAILQGQQQTLSDNFTATRLAQAAPAAHDVGHEDVAEQYENVAFAHLSQEGDVLLTGELMFPDIDNMESSFLDTFFGFEQ